MFHGFCAAESETISFNQYMITACGYYIIAVAIAHRFYMTIYGVMIYAFNQYVITACGYSIHNYTYKRQFCK